MEQRMTEHKFMADFQPLGDPTKGVGTAIFSATLNWAALFGIAYVVGLGLRLGWGS